MLSLWPRTLYFIFQQKNGYPECITASSFDTETTSAAIINKTWTDIIGTRDTAKGPPSGSGSRKRRDTTSPIETWKNPGVRANYLVNRVVVCDSKSIKITILMYLGLLKWFRHLTKVAVTSVTFRRREEPRDAWLPNWLCLNICLHESNKNRPELSGSTLYPRLF